MKLYLPRIIRTDDYTVGHLFNGTERFCYTLEDKVRPLGIKTPKKTAIPEGIYRVIVSYSPRFKKPLPLICDIPMFTGIRMHRGATADHSEGCILLGYNLINDGRISSDSAADDLTQILLKNKEEHTIKIVNMVNTAL